MSDGNGLAEAMLGLDGFRVLEVTEDPDELIINVETTVEIEGCRECGSRAEAHEPGAGRYPGSVLFGPAGENLIKRVKRIAFGFRRFRSFRIRALLYAGKPNWGLLAAVTLH